MLESYIQNNNLDKFIEECKQTMDRHTSSKIKDDQIFTVLKTIFHHNAFDFYYPLVDILKSSNRPWNYKEMNLIIENNQIEMLEYYLLNVRSNIDVVYTIACGSKIETVNIVVKIIVDNHLLSDQEAAILSALIYAICRYKVANIIMDNINWSQVSFKKMSTYLLRIHKENFLEFLQYVEPSKLADIFEIMIEHLKFSKVKLMIENYLDYIPLEINMSKILSSNNNEDDDIIHFLKKFAKVGNLLKGNGFVLKSEQDINDLFVNINFLLQDN